MAKPRSRKPVRSHPLSSRTEGGLTDRQRRFVLEYLVDLKPTEAARRAGYVSVNPNAAASRLLRLPAVKQAVAKEIAARAARTRLTGDRVLTEYARIAFADMRRFSEWGPQGVTLRSDRTMSDDDAAAIAEVSSSGKDEKTRTRIRLHAKRHALDALAKHLGLFSNSPADDPQSRAEAASRARDILTRRIDDLARKP